jgi:5,10-methylenetetrahydromethanopterin reductase
MSIEFFAAVIGLPRRSAEVARRAEAQGWTGLAFADSQNLFSDPYVAMVVAASATTTLRLATGVTNPVTRHAATTANVITSVDLESGGRAELGIGRGDSALAHIGLAPTSVEYLAEYVENVRSYLRGDAISLERAAGSSPHRSISSLPLGDAPDDSRLHWLPTGRAKRSPVPVYVVASGPKMITMAAARADRVTLAVGADADRIRWAADIAKAANPDIPLGAYVNVAVDDDLERGAEHVAGAVAAFARFSVMHGQINGPVSDSDRMAMQGLAGDYQTSKHGQSGNSAAQRGRELAGRYAIIGPAGQCVERLLELAELGIDRFHIIEVPTASPEDSFAEAVLPRFTG